MMKIQKILDDNFVGLEDAMDGDKDLAHFYKNLIGVCMQEYALDVLDELAANTYYHTSVLSTITKVEKETWE